MKTQVRIYKFTNIINQYNYFDGFTNIYEYEYNRIEYLLASLIRKHANHINMYVPYSIIKNNKILLLFDLKKIVWD